MLSEKLDKRKMVVKKKYETNEQVDTGASSRFVVVCRGNQEGALECLQTDRYVQAADTNFEEQAGGR